MQKSIFATLLACFFSVALFAQDLPEIRDMAGKNQWDKAKEGIDKYLANEKNKLKGEAWYMRSVIYNSISRDPKFSSLVADPRMEAFNAYKKYLELDKDAFEGKLNQHATLFDVAFGYLGKASETFNSKSFDEALANFKSAEIVEEYIVRKGFSYNDFVFPAYDTQLYLNVAASAVNAKKEDIALEYYQKIADKRIKSAGYEEIYRYIVDRYQDKKDMVNRDKYMAIGKEVYPNDPYWTQSELEEAGTDKQKLFAKYDKLIADNPTDYSLHYNYVVEMYNYAFVGDKRPDDYAAIDARLPIVAKKTIELNSTSEANMLMCRYHFAHINDLLDTYNAIKGTKPEDIKKKKDLTEAVNKRYDEMLPFATAIFDMMAAKPTLKPGEKGSFKLATSMLLEYWERKDDKAKIKFYQDKLKEIQ
jgi:hypothetical protein